MQKRRKKIEVPIEKKEKTNQSKINKNLITDFFSWRPLPYLLDKTNFAPQEEILLAFSWTLITFAVASAPLLMLWVIDTMLIVDSNDALKDAIFELIDDGVFMFIGLSCSGASFIDAYFSKAYKEIEAKQLKFINVSFCFLVAIICIFQATNFALKNLASDRVIIDIDAFQTSSIIVLIACFIYSIYTKAILIKLDK